MNPSPDVKLRAAFAFSHGWLCGTFADALSEGTLNPTWWAGYAAGLRMRYVCYGRVGGTDDLSRQRAEAVTAMKRMNRSLPGYLREGA